MNLPRTKLIPNGEKIVHTFSGAEYKNRQARLREHMIMIPEGHRPVQEVIVNTMLWRLQKTVPMISLNFHTDRNIILSDPNAG